MSTESDNALRLKLLLADIRDVFAKEGSVARGAEISSADMVKALVAIEGRPWAERGKNGKRGNPLTQTKLAQMLKPLAIASDHIGSVRGYKLWQFEEAFSRYLPLERGLSSRRVQELAEWYSHQAYWHYSPNALAAGALDAELRAILRKEVSPWHVEIELERHVCRRLWCDHRSRPSRHDCAAPGDGCGRRGEEGYVPTLLGLSVMLPALFGAVLEATTHRMKHERGAIRLGTTNLLRKHLGTAGACDIGFAYWLSYASPSYGRHGAMNPAGRVRCNMRIK